MSRAAILLLALLAGCQPAARYEPRPEKDRAAPPEKGEKPTPRAPEEYNWLNLGRDPEKGQVRIEFVHEGTRPKEWAALKTYWNDPGLAKTGEAPRPVLIKVPLGLDDPAHYIPADTPPTRERWELGRRLFFDTGLLGTGQSCATCHIPSNGYTDGKKAGGGERNTLSLVNVVYQRSLFWDGRATYLEEAAQRTLDDETAPDVPFRHAWPGVITRLRKSKEYGEGFNRAFGVRPTQDTVGKALATYMRTLLAAGSIHDRADARRRAAGALALTAAHYAAALDDDALKRLDRVAWTKEKVSADLYTGYTLFHGQARCNVCHPSSTGVFADGRYHNIDIAAGLGLESDPPRRGRFNVAPLGEKSRWLMGAWRTPTLRGLSRTAPYFHDGSEAKLFDAVNHHVRKRAFAEAPENFYLSRHLATDDGNFRDFGLPAGGVEAITLFLRALDGEEVDPFVRNPPG